MEYRVVLLCNGKYKKTLYRCRTRETAFINFHKINDENNVMFPKRFVNAHKIKSVKYSICVTKPTEPTDTFRLLRNDIGQLYTEKPLGDWTILHSDDYDIEETFWIYGLDPRHDRPTIKEVVKRLSTGAYKKDMIKQVLVVHNKLVIYNEDHFDMIICKCKSDAQRLHHLLRDVTRKQKIRSLLFMGTATPATIPQMYHIIQINTGWRIEKIRRTTTRP